MLLWTFTALSHVYGLWHVPQNTFLPLLACLVVCRCLSRILVRKKFSYFKGSLTRDFRIQFLDFFCSSNLKNTDDRFILFSVADPGCLSRIRLFSIPDPNCLHPGSRKEFKYFNKKKLFLRSRKYDPGCSSRIPDPQH
jgi:hypothetical protein